MIEVKTIVSEQLMTEFNLFQARKKIWVPLAAAVVLIALGLMMLSDPDIGLFSFIVLAGVGVLLPALYWVAVRAIIRRAIKNSPMLKSTLTQIYHLGDAIYINESSKYIHARDMDYAWELLLKAVETPSAFYLYINKIQAFIVDKKGFSMGTPTDLHALLLEKMPPKKFKFPARLYK